MILKVFVILFFLQVLAVNKCQPAMCNPLSLSLSHFGMKKNNAEGNFNRKKRCLSSTISLLWPQVVGPVEQGKIEELSYSDVPKTSVEHYLDLLRGKARHEEDERLMIRQYIKSLTEAQDRVYGHPSYIGSFRADLKS